ncbi:MAG: hypothetical protein V2I33_17165 [Kangiellaceae bacterium]|nr:hypothetical protein [Kangiellaceae bacterium]
MKISILLVLRTISSVSSSLTIPNFTATTYGKLGDTTTLIDESETGPGSAVTLNKGLPSLAVAELYPLIMSQGQACANRHGIFSFKIRPNIGYAKGYILKLNLKGFALVDPHQYEVFIGKTTANAS